MKRSWWMVGMTLTATAAHADDLYVCNGPLYCYTDIQSALDAAVTGDTVFIEAGDYVGSLVVRTGVNLVGTDESEVTIFPEFNEFALPGVVQFVSTDPASVTGLTIDAQNINRCIFAEETDLTLSSVTLVRGEHPLRGGGLSARESTLVAEQVTFAENASSREGGAIYLSENSVLMLDQSTVSTSRAEAGGAVFVTESSILDATDTLFSLNESFPIGYYRTPAGAGIYAKEAPVILDDCTLDSNNSNELGGALFMEGGSLTVTGGLFTGNTSITGGAIASEYADLDIADVTFEANVANTNGGAISASGGTLKATDVTFSLNSVIPGHGGAIQVDQQGALDLVNTSFEQNSAVLYGGAIDAFSAVSLYISGGVFLDNASRWGSAIAIDDDNEPRNFTLEDVAFSSNVNLFDGTILLEGDVNDAGVTLDVQRCLFEDNLSFGDGGSIAVVNTGGLWVEDSEFISNIASIGGAISVQDAPAHLLRNHFCRNLAAEGGAVALSSSATLLDWTNNLFVENLASEHGGAVWVQGAELQFLNNTLAGNAASLSGGGVWADGVTLDFSNNLTFATLYGDGLTVQGGAINALTNNAWWFNANVDTNVEAALRVNDLILTGPTPPVRNYTGGCENQDFVIHYEGDLFDAGDPALADPDGDISDIGFLGGPDADEDPWADTDGDGIAAMWDCLDTSPLVGAPQTWFADDDGDTWGAPNPNGIPTCEPPVVGSWVNLDGDCDDQNEDIYPGAPEWCDDVDTDCDGVTNDPDSIDADVWYLDSDGDGWGDVQEVVIGCAPSDQYTQQDGDCDDQNARAFPGAEEIWYDGIDQDCNGSSDFDQDGDGFDSTIHLLGGEDCNDTNGNIFPGANDRLDDKIDQDCNGVIATTWMNGGGGCTCDTGGRTGLGWIALTLGLVAMRRRATYSTETTHDQ
jgi:predicted outer membrane repeat protein